MRQDMNGRSASRPLPQAALHADRSRRMRSRITAPLDCARRGRASVFPPNAQTCRHEAIRIRGWRAMTAATLLRAGLTMVALAATCGIDLAAGAERGCTC